MRTEPEPPRRSVLATAAAALTGAVLGWSVYKGTGPDLSFVAECWIEDALALGMWVGRGPDGQVWRCAPIADGAERTKAREAHWTRLNARPRLMRAVYAKVESGFVPGATA